MESTTATVLSNLFLVSIPSLLIGGGLYMTMRAYIQRDQNLRLLELRHSSDKESKLLRLQAYERMILFLERISIASLLGRVMDSDMLSPELQLAMIRSIRSEFDHNLTQQLYISSNSWSLIVSAKDELIKVISVIGERVPTEATAQQYARVLLEAITSTGQMLPNETALEYLREEGKNYL